MQDSIPVDSELTDLKSFTYIEIKRIYIVMVQESSISTGICYILMRVVVAHKWISEGKEEYTISTGINFSV